MFWISILDVFFNHKRDKFLRFSNPRKINKTNEIKPLKPLKPKNKTKQEARNSLIATYEELFWAGKFSRMYFLIFLKIVRKCKIIEKSPYQYYVDYLHPGCNFFTV